MKVEQGLRVEGQGSRCSRPSPLTLAPLPRRLAHAGNHSRQRQLAETNTTETEAAQKRPRTAATTAAVMLTHGELRLPLALLDHGLTSHCKLSLKWWFVEIRPR